MCMTMGNKGNDDIQRYDSFSSNNENMREYSASAEYSYKMEAEIKEFSAESTHKEESKSSEREPTQSQVADSISRIASSISSMAKSLYSHVPENIRNGISDGLSNAYSKAIDIYQGAKEIFINEIKPELVNIGDAMGDLIIAGLEKISDTMGWSDNSTETQLWTRINEHEDYLEDKFESSMVEKYDSLNDFLAEKAGVAPDERFTSLPELKEQFDSGEINQYGYVSGMQDDEKFFQLFEVAESRLELCNKYEEALTTAEEKGFVTQNEEGDYITTKSIVVDYYEADKGDYREFLIIPEGTTIGSIESLEERMMGDIYNLYKDFSNDDISVIDFENAVYDLEAEFSASMPIDMPIAYAEHYCISEQDSDYDLHKSSTTASGLLNAINSDLNQ